MQNEFTVVASLDIGPSMCFASAYSHVTERLVVAGEDCSVRIYSKKENYKRSSIVFNSAMTERKELRMPVTALRFKPGDLTEILMVATCDGSISFWHLGTSRIVQSFKEDSSGTYTAEYSPSGSTLCTGGTDGRIRLYDPNRNNSFSCELFEGLNADMDKAHSSRIQSIRFADEFTMLTAGWDRAVFVWDLRAGGKPVSCIDGPYLCGDGLDVYESQVLCASSERTENQIEVFDLRTTLRLSAVTLSSDDDGSPSLYAARFSKSGTIAVGGTRFRGLFALSGSELTASFSERTLSSTAFSVAWDDRGSHCFFGGRSGVVLNVR